MSGGLGSNDGVVNLKGRIEGGHLVALYDHAGNELGVPVTGIRAPGGKIGKMRGAISDNVIAEMGHFSQIVGASKIRKMLAAIAQSSYRRVNIGLHSHSIGYGVNANDATVFDAAAATEWMTQRYANILAKRLGAAYGSSGTALNAAIGGTSDLLNPLFSLAGAAVANNSTPILGPCGWRVISGNAGQNLSFSAAGSAARVYLAYGATAFSVLPKWSAPGVASGADQTPTLDNPLLTPTGDRLFCEFTMAGLTPGETVTIKGQAGCSISIYYIDLDYRPTAPGVSIHCLCDPGSSLTQIHGASIDDTDVNPLFTSWAGAAGSTGAKQRATQAASMSTRIPFDGVIVATDGNDLNEHALRGYTLADMQRHLSNYLAYHAALRIPVLALFGPLRDPTFQPGTRPYDQLQLIQAYKDVIDASAGAAYLDLTTEFTGSLSSRYADQVSAGINASGDIIHPGKMGHAHDASLVASALLGAMSF